MSFKSTRKKSNFKQITRITLVWMIVGFFLTIYDFVITSNSEFFIQTEEYSFLLNLGLNLFGAMLGGITAGSFIVLYATRKLRKKSFLYYVFVNSIVILILVLIIDFIANILLWSVIQEKWFIDKEALLYTWNYLYNILLFRSMAIWFSLTLGTTFLIRLSEGYGPGVVTDIIKGKYHKPVVEERIFMFLDIKSSTTLAEKLGHEKYFQLLSEFFSDTTDAIIYSQGEIYQYVGDEVVVSWRIRDGIKNNNCLYCFFEAKKEIRKQSGKYLDYFGIVPEFKAGLHLGYATVGEIGVLKKIIAFSGDVLNTTSRIQSNCNKLNSELLISEELMNRIELDDTLKATKLDEIELRGKRQKTRLISITEN